MTTLNTTASTEPFTYCQEDINNGVHTIHICS